MLKGIEAFWYGSKELVISKDKGKLELNEVMEVLKKKGFDSHYYTNNGFSTYFYESERRLADSISLFQIEPDEPCPVCGNNTINLYCEKCYEPLNFEQAFETLRFDFKPLGNNYRSDLKLLKAYLHEQDNLRAVRITKSRGFINYDDIREIVSSYSDLDGGYIIPLIGRQFVKRYKHEPVTDEVILYDYGWGIQCPICKIYTAPLVCSSCKHVNNFKG